MNKVLIISFLNAQKSIGGMPNRFAVLWKHLRIERGLDNYYLLTTKSLANKLFSSDFEDKNMSLIDDYSSSYNKNKYFLFYKVLRWIKKNDIKSIHIAGGGTIFIPLIFLVRFMGVKVAVTFASNNLMIAGYGNKKRAKIWEIILRLTKNVDFVKLTHDVPNYGYKKFMSPCSFPYILQTGPKYSERNFFNPNREQTIIFNGAFEKIKNPILALDGFEKYLEKYKSNEARLLVFGNGVLANEIDMKIEEINKKFNREAVARVPFDNLSKTLAEASIFLSLVNHDNYSSQSLMEAMLFCNTIIATDVGDTKLLVKQELGNYLINKDANELAEALHSALSKNIQMNRRNHDEVMQNHNINKFGDYFISMHNNLK